MKFARLLVPTVASFTILGACFALVGCGAPAEPKNATIAPGSMPDGEAWTGVYFHPLYGYLHIVEEGTSIRGRWRRADQSKWGELSGTKTGNVVHYKWTEHTNGGIGASAVTSGRGYFVYKLDTEKRAVLEGQFGLDDSEVGSDWSNLKQVRMQPDLRSIGGDAEGVPPNGF